MSEREPGLGQTAFGNPFQYLVLPVEQCLQPEGSLDMYVCSLDFMHLPVFCKLVARLTQLIVADCKSKEGSKEQFDAGLTREPGGSPLCRITETCACTMNQGCCDDFFFFPFNYLLVVPHLIGGSETLTFWVLSIFQSKKSPLSF